MEMLITVFHRYASKEGGSASLNRRELKMLMEAELGTFLKVQHSICYCYTQGGATLNTGLGPQMIVGPAYTVSFRSF